MRDDLLDRIDGAQRVGNVGDRDQRVRGLSSFSNSSSISSPRSLMGRRAARAPFSSHSICQGTMLEWCSMAEIRISSPGLDVCPAQSRDQIDAFGRAAHEDHVSAVACIDERCALTRAPRRPRCSARSAGGRRDGCWRSRPVEPTSARSPPAASGGRGVVQIHQRLAVHLLFQDREILADPFHVEARTGLGSCRSPGQHPLRAMFAAWAL